MVPASCKAGRIGVILKGLRFDIRRHSLLPHGLIGQNSVAVRIKGGMEKVKNLFDILILRIDRYNINLPLQNRISITDFQHDRITHSCNGRALDIMMRLETHGQDEQFNFDDSGGDAWLLSNPPDSS
jgi:hypothetical protein